MREENSNNTIKQKKKVKQKRKNQTFNGNTHTERKGVKLTLKVREGKKKSDREERG